MGAAGVIVVIALVAGGGGGSKDSGGGGLLGKEPTTAASTPSRPATPGTSTTPAPSPVAASTDNLLFVTDRDGHKEIYVMGADGSNPKRLTNGTSANDLPN